MSSNNLEESPLLGSPKRASERWLTVEPIIVLYTASLFPFVISVIPLYIEQTLAEERNFTRNDDEINGTCSDSNIITNPDYVTQQEIAAETALLVMISTALIYFPALFISPFCGSLSDRLGRKLNLLIPNLALLGAICVCLIFLYLKVSLLVFVSMSVIIGLGGGYTFLLAGCNAYIADITCGKKRLVRMAILQATFFGTAGLAQLPVGYIIELYDIPTCMWIFFALTVCNIFYIIIPGCLYESVHVKAAPLNGILLKEAFMDAIHLVTDNSIRATGLLLLYLIYFITNIIQTSQAGTQIFVLYGIGPPFCWSAVTEAFFTFAFLGAGTLGVLVGTKLFSLCLGNFWILQIAYGSELLGCTMAALAPTTAVFILGAILGGLRAMSSSVLNAMLSTTVSPSEQGVAFAVQSSVHSLGNFISPLILNPIYSATVGTQPNLVFYIMGIVCIFLFILSWLWKYCSTKRGNGNIENNR